MVCAHICMHFCTYKNGPQFSKRSWRVNSLQCMLGRTLSSAKVSFGAESAKIIRVQSSRAWKKGGKKYIYVLEHSKEGDEEEEANSLFSLLWKGNIINHRLWQSDQWRTDNVAVVDDDAVAINPTIIDCWSLFRSLYAL